MVAPNIESLQVTAQWVLPNQFGHRARFRAVRLSGAVYCHKKNTVAISMR
jgi:hypothetical protein